MFSLPENPTELGDHKLVIRNKINSTSISRMPSFGILTIQPHTAYIIKTCKANRAGNDIRFQIE
jgi:hypothetical protein